MNSHPLSPRLSLVHVLAVLAALIPGLAVGQVGAAGKLDALLQTRAHQLGGQSRIIVEFSTSPDPRVVTSRRGLVGRQLDSMRALVADVDNAALLSIATDSRVVHVYLDRPAFATLERTGATTGAALARQELGLTGVGVGVAVIDSGVEATHDDLTFSTGVRGHVSRRVVHSRDFTRHGNPRVWASEVSTDDYGHGTHVAGIIAGSGFASDGARTGIAPQADLVSLKVLDGHGLGHVSDVIAAIDYAIAIKDTYNLRVINLSVASGVFDSYRRDPLTLAARRAVEAGIVVVAAAGNLGAGDAGARQFGGITSPGNAPWVLTVGAANHHGTTQRNDDTIAGFSSAGPTRIDFAAKPDLVAPGVGIESLAAPHSDLYDSYSGYLLDGTGHAAFKPYLSLSGTSMAAPVVTGTVALMLEANPSLTPNAVKALLQYAAEVRTDEHALVQGAGLLNARGAVRLAEFFAHPGDGLPDMGDILDGEWVAWGRQIFWGNWRIDGGIPLPGSNAWASNVAWGDPATVSGQPIVWGVRYDENLAWSTALDNIVWSTALDNIVWSTALDNIVWSTALDNIVWSTALDNIVWSTALDNIVWSTALDNIVWSTALDNIVWSTALDNIVWSTALDNIVWSTEAVDQVLWPAPR